MNTDQALPGTKFMVYQLTCTDAAPGHIHDELAGETSACWSRFVENELVSDSNGIVSCELDAGIFMLVETQAVEGYELPRGQWKIEANPTAADPADALIITSVGDMPPAFMKEADGSLKLLNMPVVVMPVMGGPGTMLFTLCGLLLVGSAMVLLMTDKRIRRILRREEK